MKIPTRLKEALLVIGSGVTGAFLFGGGSVILLILTAALIQGMPWIGLIFLAPLWTTERVFEFFILAALAGFVIGIVKRHSKFIKIWMSSAFIIGIPLLIVLWQFDKYTFLVSTPHDEKLTDFTNGVATVHLQIPKGHDYHLYLTLSEPPSADETNSPYMFSGSISIETGTTLITNLPIHLNKSALGGSSVVLTGVGGWNTNVPPLSQFIEPQKEYDFQVILNPPPPPSSSIWLYWATVKDRHTINE